jgi:AP-1 complex subunit gamma-1
MCQDLASEVEKLLHSTNAYIRKKAVLAMLRICRKCPHMIENYVDRLASLLNDRRYSIYLLYWYKSTNTDAATAATACLLAHWRC